MVQLSQSVSADESPSRQRCTTSDDTDIVIDFATATATAT